MPYPIISLVVKIETRNNDLTVKQLVKLRSLFTEDVSFEDLLESYLSHAVRDCVRDAEGKDLDPIRNVDLRVWFE